MSHGTEFSRLSSAERKRTPPAFGLYLYSRLTAWLPSDRVAVLWLERSSWYYASRLDLDLWGPGRDARKYAGPYPIIAHPPCGPWGMMKGLCQQPKEDGIIAMDLVHKYGGVVEQPLGSSLFREHGRAGHRLEVVDQRDYGHRLRKRTLLYWVV